MTWEVRCCSSLAVPVEGVGDEADGTWQPGETRQLPAIQVAALLMQYPGRFQTGQKRGPINVPYRTRFSAPYLAR